MECCKDPSKQTLRWSYDFSGNNSWTPIVEIYRQSFNQIVSISTGGTLVNIGSRVKAFWGEAANQTRDRMPRNICGIDSINKGD